MDFAERYRVIESRDSRFDGQFVTAVRSTGIYCRPSCPARTPKQSNVTFYVTSAAAHEAGYRACKRCLPEAVPGTPEWNIRSDVAGRAMRLIADGVVDREGVPGLAAKLGYSTRQLSRTLSAELGAGPLSLARAARAQTARTLLTGTTLPLSEIAFASGFTSIRQFNDTITEVFATTPTHIRETSRKRLEVGETDVPAGTIRLRLPFREPFDGPGIFAFIGGRAVPGVELYSSGPHPSYARAIQLDHGAAYFKASWIGGEFVLEARMAELSDLPSLIARVRRLFDLDADPGAIDASLARDPHLAASAAATPGIRLPGALHGEEMLIRALVGQQISVKAARTWLSRLAAVGSPTPSGLTSSMPDDESIVGFFPTAAQIAEHGRDIMRGPAARISSFIGVIDKLAEGELEVGVADDPEELRERLVALRGVGPWTAGYVAMRVLSAPDILPPGDVALRTGARNLGITEPVESYASALSPWRSYASLHFWNASLPPAKQPAPV